MFKNLFVKIFLLSISMLVILGKVFVKFLWTLIKRYFQKKMANNFCKKVELDGQKQPRK